MALKIEGDPLFRATVSGVDGFYGVNQIRSFFRVNFFEKNHAHVEGDYSPGNTPYKVYLLASIPAGTYGDPSRGIAPRGNPDASSDIKSAILRHATQYLAEHASRNDNHTECS